jgi:ABC-2 type transport system permease protein
VRPGDSPFAQPQGTGSPAGPIQAVSFFTIIVLALPALVVAAMGLIYSPLWHLVSLAYGVVVGLTVLLVGVSWGSRIYDRRTSELLAFAMRN